MTLSGSILNLHAERAVLATIDFALAAEYHSFDTAPALSQKLLNEQG